MDETTVEKKSAMPKWVQIALLAAGIVLIAIGLFKIFGGGSGSSTFLDKFNELQSPTVAIRDDLTSVGSLLSGIGAKEAKKDYAGIISDLQTALTKLDDVSAKVASTSSALADFQKLLDTSSDQNIKSAGARFVDATKLRDAAALKMVNDAKDLVNQAITYYTEVSKNQKITIDVNKFTAAASTFSTNSQSMTSIGAQYDAAANDFAKAAGFAIEKK